MTDRQLNLGSLLIIGGASLDLLRFSGRVERSIGGAGLYTSLAARRAGADVTMFAPRPSPMPLELVPVAERVNWIGPIVAPAELPSFEIAHYGHGKAELVNARWGAESLLTTANLPSTPIQADIVYCGPLADPARQLAFLRHFKERGHRIAVGTYGRAVENFRAIVRQTFEVADIFFCNANEAARLFGRVEDAGTRLEGPASKSARCLIGVPFSSSAAPRSTSCALVDGRSVPSGARDCIRRSRRAARAPV